MTCWIEDELHLEEHGPIDILRRERRPCNAYCQDGIHATVAFITARLSADSLPGHAVSQFTDAHRPRWAVKAEPAHEVTPEMYPNRVHRGAPAEDGEGATAWLVYFKEQIKEKENDESG